MYGPVAAVYIDSGQQDRTNISDNDYSRLSHNPYHFLSVPKVCSIRNTFLVPDSGQVKCSGRVMGYVRVDFTNKLQCSLTLSLTCDFTN